MLMRRVDGVVVMPSFDELEPYQQLSLRRIPTVAIDSRRTGSYFSDVSIMHEEGMLQAILYLKALGHQRIAFIAGHEGIFISSLRLEAFRNAMRQHASVVKNEYIRAGNYRVDAGDREMRALLSLPERPTAVITINDMTALGALRAAREMSVSVPQEVSVIGFDGIVLDEVVYPTLSTMSVSRCQLARNCHTALGELKVSPQNGKQFWVPVELTCRQSTGPAAPVKGKGAKKKT
jgi:LacI family transcriptional regulator